MNGDYREFSFTLDGKVSTAFILVNDNQPTSYTVRFTNLTPNTEYVFGIYNSNTQTPVPDTELSVTTDGGNSPNSGMSDGARIAIIFGSIIGFLLLAYAYNRYL